MAQPRSLAERAEHARAALAAPEADGWVATASPDGESYLVPLSIGWTGSSIVLVTMSSSPTAKNLPLGAVVRVGLGATREVTLVEAEVVAVHALDASPHDAITAFAQQSGRNAPAGADAGQYQPLS